MAVTAEARAKWSFGTAATQEGGNANNSTGTGVRVFIGGLAREHTFWVETDGSCTASYQILVWRNGTGGASQVLSSGTLAAGALDVIHFTGPIAWVAPRIKTMTSTSVNVHVELYGN